MQREDGSRWIGGAFIVTAIVVAGLAVRTMTRAQTAVNPHGPTTAIVTDGPFRYTRNPLYLSLVLIFLGVSACLDSLSMLVLVIPFMAVLIWGVIPREEPYLEAKFGDEYRTYKARVRRWL
ncbi:MAG: isoprenylcysteine carboxylmethyltransferase family protein [Alphaproteobacteria bacterium]|nr:isoprenylcysteine carboxylmethyltransferase family protein [Alphaproteobacteria bacterium]